MTNLDSILKSRDITLLTKVGIFKAMVFPVVRYRCKRWTIKKTECQTEASELWFLRRFSWESLDCKKIKPVNSKGYRPWIFIVRTDAEAEAAVLWSPDVKSRLIGKDPDGGKDWGQQKGVKEDEMFGWHHWLNGHEFAQTLGDSEGQGNLVCCSSWDHKQSDTT